jgi:hypothetical protein
MARRVVFEPNQKNFGPKVFVQGVLGLDHSEVVDGRDHAAIEDDEVVFTRREDDALLTSSGEKPKDGNGTDATEAA